MTFLNCFTLSCPGESSQLLAGFDQGQRWNPQFENTDVLVWIFLNITHKYIVGKK